MTLSDTFIIQAQPDPVIHKELTVTTDAAAHEAVVRSPGRRTYVIGACASIVIGIAHTITQFTTLSSETVRAQYRAGGDIRVNSEVVDGWDLFAGTSILMGVFCIMVGAINLAALRALGRPTAMICAINMIGLGCVALVGYFHLSYLQLYGGIAGLFLFGLPLVEVVRGRGR